MRSKVFFSVLFILLLGIVHSKHRDLDEDELKCINELNLNKNAILDINILLITPENNVDFNNFLGCYWKKKKFQNENGDIDFDKIDEFVLLELLKKFGDNPDDLASVVAGIFESAFSECKTKCIRGNTHGQTAVKVQNCIAEVGQRRVLEITGDL